jgi:hypothetical protein
MDGFGVLAQQKSDVLAWGQNDPNGLTYHNGELFWSETSFYPLKELDLSTGEITSFGRSMTTITSLTVSDDTILWTDEITDFYRALMITDADGASYRALAIGRFEDTYFTNKVLCDGSYAYWITINNMDQDTGYIERVPLDGSDPEIIATTDSIKDMAMDDSYIYWSQGGNGCKLFRCLRSENQGTIETVFEDDTIVLIGDIAFTDDKIIFCFYDESYNIASIPKNGGVVTVIANEKIQPIRIMADEKAVYWRGSLNLLCAVPISGGEVTTLLEYNAVSVIRDLVLSENRLYWVGLSSNDDDPLGIYYVDKSGGPINILSEAFSPAYIQVKDGDNVVYADGGTIGYHDTEPTGIYHVTSESVVNNIVSGIDFSSIIAVNDQFVYAAQGCSVKRVEHGGDNATIVAVSDGCISGLQADETYVYWIDDYGVGSVSRSSVDETASAELIVSASGGSEKTLLRVHGGYVYWVEDDSMYRTPQGGGDVQLIADNLETKNYVVDDEYVYLIEEEGGRGKLSKIPVAGGEKIFISDARLNFGWFAMAQDSDNIYWATSEGFYKSPKVGLYYESYDIPSPFGQWIMPVSLVVDDQYIYWSEPSTGSIKREFK